MAQDAEEKQIPHSADSVRNDKIGSFAVPMNSGFAFAPGIYPVAKELMFSQKSSRLRF